MARRVRRGSRARAALRTAAGPLVVASAVLGGVSLLDASPSAAQGCAPRLVVSRTDGLSAAGETVTVSGSCFDVAKGVYVAFCVVPPAGSVPSPCGGGVDMSGANGLSHWISSNPPPQGVGLTTPYGPGGSFTVTMRPSAQLNTTVDCRRVRCAIVTRNDHTRSSDRSQDVIVPVTFAVDPAPTTAPPAAPAAPPTTAAPAPVAEPTTTAPPEDTTPTTAAEAPTATEPSGEPDDDPGEELAAEPASASGGSGSGAALGLGAVALVAVAGGGAGWYAMRRRGASGADGASDGGAA